MTVQSRLYCTLRSGTLLHAPRLMDGDARFQICTALCMTLRTCAWAPRLRGIHGSPVHETTSVVR